MNNNFATPLFYLLLLFLLLFLFGQVTAGAEYFRTPDTGHYCRFTTGSLMRPLDLNSIICSCKPISLEHQLGFYDERKNWDGKQHSPCLEYVLPPSIVKPYRETEKA